MRSGYTRGRRGFTVVEVTIVIFLIVLLVSILSSVWRGLCLPAIDAAARCRIVQEANLAAASLARDLGGNLPDPTAQTGAISDGLLVGRQTPSPGWLRLCFHGTGSGSDLSPKWGAPDTVISYQLQGNSLIRWNEESGSTVTVANGLTGFQVNALEDNSGVEIVMTFEARGNSLSYDLVTVDP